MNKFVLCILSILALSFGVSAGHALAQDMPSPAVEAEAPDAGPESGFDVLLGLWVRPDGGYLIAIQGVDSSGKLDAAYANPHHLPFAKAEASREGNTIRVFLELRAGGYNGSTYTLTYDPVKDILEGVYYQAVAQQKFDVHFERANR
jgi:hypothetical protein